MTQPLESLLQSTGMWRASAASGFSKTGISSGFPALNRILPGQGWPHNGLTELLHDHWGIGEIGLIAPALAHLSQCQLRWITWISPPFIPYAPALAAEGIDLNRVLVVRPRLEKDKLWALEKSLASQCCSAVLAWPGSIRDQDIRRLQLACRSGNCWGVIFRPASAARQFSPAELRIRLEASALSGLLHLSILKRRGGWATDVHLKV